jgi:hypothetical protein
VLVKCVLGFDEALQLAPSATGEGERVEGEDDRPALEVGQGHRSAAGAIPHAEVGGGVAYL